MKNFAVIFFVLLCSSLFGQHLNQSSWQQKVDYSIDVVLNDASKRLTGFARIVYYNNSPDTLNELLVHLWANAYSNNQTPFAQQQVRNGETDFYFSKENEKGYITDLMFESNEQGLEFLLDSNVMDVGRVLLNEPLLPGEMIEVSTPFVVKIPKLFSRMGYSKGYNHALDFQVTQWFPKIAMYDINGWHPNSYFDLGEFYDNFGDYDIKITVPKNYTVAATGVLEDGASEEHWMDTLYKESLVPRKKVGAPRWYGYTGTKTLHYRQNNVHDFAWFASNYTVRMEDSVRLSSGKMVKTYIYEHFPKKENMEALKTAVKFYSDKVGEYPYESCSVVSGDLLAGGGMEYPMITVISQMSPRVIVHEVGHNWFQGILATDERRYPWMDEGVNSFYEDLYFEEQPYHKPRHLLDQIDGQELKYAYKHQCVLNEDQAASLHSDSFTMSNYGIVVYGKVALMFQYLNRHLGDELFEECMHNYYEKWKFKHPLPKDMQASFEKTSGQDLSWFFVDGLNSKVAVVEQEEGWTMLPHGANNTKAPKKKWHLTTLKEIDSKNRNTWHLLPAFAWNEHNKWMVGAYLSNEFIFAEKIKLELMPLYSFDEGSLNGFANIEQRIKKEWGPMYRMDLGVKSSRFNYKVGGDELHYNRIKPYVRLNFRDKSRQREGRINQLEFSIHSITASGDSSERFSINNRGHFVTSYFYNNGKKINNLKIRTQLEYGVHANSASNGNYSKLNLEVLRDFSYEQKGKKLKVRVFMGKFLHKSKSRLDGIFNYRLSQNNGISDYLMEDMFLYRSPEFNTSLFSRQLEQNGGAMRNPVKSIRTDKWLFAANMESTLPGKIPLRVFLDLGYGRAQKINAITGVYSDDEELNKKLLYTGGLSLVLAEDVFEVYFPLVFSENFENRYKDADIGFAERISFKLNFNLANPLKWKLF